MKRGSQIRQGWLKPPEGKVTVNVNAAFDEDVGCGSVGVAIRDSTGGVLAAAHRANYTIRLHGGRTNNEGWRFHGKFSNRLI